MAVGYPDGERIVPPRISEGSNCEGNCSADSNTVCGQVNNNARYVPGNGTEFAPTFTNSVQPGTKIPETPLTPTLVAAAGVAAIGLVRRRRTRMPR